MTRVVFIACLVAGCVHIAPARPDADPVRLWIAPDIRTDYEQPLIDVEAAVLEHEIGHQLGLAHVRSTCLGW